MLRIQTISVVPLLLVAACVEPFYPPSESQTTNGFLVIDGFLDGANGTGTVRLSRSVLLSEPGGTLPEVNAIVSVEVDNGGSFLLSEEGNGLYAADHLDLSSSLNYRLHIQTQDDASYSSDVIQLLQSPSFDSLYWQPGTDGISFFVNAHDDLNKTRYYHYSFTDTWEYRVTFVSLYKWEDGRPVLRKDNELVATCWKSGLSTRVMIVSTNGLRQDIVSNFPVNFIKKGSRTLARTYSLMVEQRAISESEYEYWDLIKKSNETLGGLFDPIPSQVVGNVRNDEDPNESVLGYFSGGFPRQKRIFITYDDLPENLKSLDQLGYSCGLSTIRLDDLSELGYNVFVTVLDPSIGKYYVASPNCADCRSLGGDTIKPNYWPQ